MYATTQGLWQLAAYRIALFKIRIRLLRSPFYRIPGRNYAASKLRRTVARLERAFAAFANVPYRDVYAEREMIRLLDCLDEDAQFASRTHRNSRGL
jgi:hypothetical protein